MKEKIEQIKQKQDKLAKLLDLYKKSVENEGRLYHLFEDDIVNNTIRNIREHKYYLVNRETKEVVCYGDKGRLILYMRFRSINDIDVMNDVSNFGD